MSCASTLLSECSLLFHIYLFATSAVYPTSVLRNLPINLFSLFQICNTFFFFMLAGSFFSKIQIILDSPHRITDELAVSLPRQANFYLCYVSLMAFVGTGYELTRITQLCFVTFFSKWCVFSVYISGLRNWLTFSSHLQANPVLNRFICPYVRCLLRFVSKLPGCLVGRGFSLNLSFPSSIPVHTLSA